MILPLAVLYGFELWGNGGLRRPQSLGLACASWTAGALMFLAILWSSSRMGLIVGLFVLLLAIASALSDKPFSSRRHRWAVGAGASAAIVIATVLLFPDQLAGRFAALLAGEHLTTEIRTSLWKETLPLLSEYRLFGCGLGGFESVFSRHQSVTNAYVVEFAHNDYLQYLAELGILGFALGAGAIALLGSKVLRGLSSERKLENWKLLSACAIGLAGLALHSFVDFNTYIPANAMTMAWLAGMASATVQE
jgi:O-antigen ligase